MTRAAGRTFLGRLACDTRGNTLAMLAIFLIPLSAIVGSAVDMARLYVVKVRLQQACDAGVLAGRKFMTDVSASTLDPAATAQAQAFFGNNFRSGWMVTKSATFTPTKTSDSQVSGTASVVVPMTIMKMFQKGDVTLNVTCEARYDVADADIMFVLDTTGSMAAKPDGSGAGSVQSYTRPDGTTGYYVQEASGSKLSGLRSAVLNFYDTLSTAVDPTTKIRYGFVTYTSAVNVGKLLPSDYLAKSAPYQSRSIIGDANNGSSSTQTYSNMNPSDCSAYNKRSPTSGYTTNGTANVSTATWSNNNSTTSSGASKGTCTVVTQPVKPNWRYQQVTYDTSQYITGAAVTDPSKITGATSTWQGCIEERQTTAGQSTFDINNLPPDLDPDLVPTNDATRWKPMWPDVVYYRGLYWTADYAGNGNNPYGDYWPNSWDSQTTAYTNMPAYAGNGWAKNISSGFVSCGKPAQRLTEMSRDDVSAYVNASDFRAQGGTYHDTGMIWGTRLISPTGIFASDTAAWPGHQAPNRYIVFMTDGDMAPNTSIYGMYGMELYDQRVTGGNYGSDTDYHNARFVAECQAAKARNITVFVVGFGQSLTDQLTACASPGQAYYAADNASLNDAFAKIANQVAMLRISK